MFWNFLTRSLWSVRMSGRCFTSWTSASYERKNKSQKLYYIAPEKNKAEPECWYWTSNCVQVNCLDAVFLPDEEISIALGLCLCHHSAPRCGRGSAETLSPCSSTQQNNGSENLSEGRTRTAEDRQTRASWLDWQRCESQPGWMCSLPLAVYPSAVEDKVKKEHMSHEDLLEYVRQNQF